MTDEILFSCKKIGIMGGTFNPIHVGHILMAQWAKEFAGLDAVMFIPAGIPYMKSGKKIADGESRFKMVEMSICKEDGFFASDIEIKRSGYTYTYETLQELTVKYPDTEFFFIMGADSLYSFKHWVHPERILDKCTIIAAARGDTGMDALEEKCQELTAELGGKILLMNFPAMDISSTMIRDRIKAGKSIRYLTTDRVCEYIEREKLYQ